MWVEVLVNLVVKKCGVVEIVYVFGYFVIVEKVLVDVFVDVVVGIWYIFIGEYGRK